MKVFFCGDISPTADNAHLFAAGDETALFSDVKGLFSQADFRVVNLECAVTDSVVPIRKIGPAIAAPKGTAAVLARLGVTHCNLSNNHFFDFGIRGAEDSLAALEEAGLGYTGFGKNEADARQNLVLELNGETFCIIAVCEHEYSYALPNRMGCRAFDPFETPLAIRAAKEIYDRVAVLYHGGKEQCRYPSPRLLSACRAMAKSGADLILCQHSHCIGCYEQFEGCHIVYGQGNFHFVKETCRIDPGWHEGLGVLYDTETLSVQLQPVVSDPGSPGIRLADTAEKAQILSDLEIRSRSLADGSWKEGWHTFCESKRELYTKAVRLACTEEAGAAGVQKFAHYLDCEAHTDVWRELFPTYNHTNETDR